ncbi:MAG: PKD domain-containing protein, partial [Isosphaeraceae bacterium]|nr:PKD domain-containing protein [Isosphaeraceae bacterium]
MNRRLRRKPVVLSIESLEERQLLRHSAVLPADLDSWLQDVVVQWRTERAKLREERLALRADHSQHAPHQPLLAKAPHGRHGHRTREHRGTGPLGGQTTAAPVPGGTTTTITTAPPASTGVTTGSRPPGAHPNTSGPTISIQPGSTFGQEGGGITTTTPIATFQLLNGQANASDFTATIQWNDGSGGTSNGNVQTDPYNGGFDVFPPSHTFSEEGTYEPTVTVNYDGGASASTTATASIQDAMLTGTSVAISATSGKSFSGTVATFTDGNPNPSQGDFSATIDWGDNSTTSGSIGTTMVSGQTVFTVTGNHTYSIQSQYAIENVRVTINDKGGANTQVTSMATVVSPPLAVTGGGTYTAYVNQNFSNTLATFSGGVASGGYSAQINWGDGGTSNGSIAGSQVKGNHTYQSVGTYTVTITVTNNGINASATDTVKVKNPPPQVAPNLCSKPGLAQQDACPTGGNPGALAMSISGIDTATGAVLSADPLDLESDGFGMTWGQGLGWSNVPGAANGSNNGNGMVNAFLPSLNQFPNSAYASAYIEMVDSPYNNVPFTTDQYGRP